MARHRWPGGWSDQSIARFRYRADQAHGLEHGAPFETEAELRKAAEIQVAEIVERVKAAGLSGGLKKWNTRYRQYRLAQVAKAEKAIPYSAFLEQFVITPTVRNVAATGRAI